MVSRRHSAEELASSVDDKSSITLFTTPYMNKKDHRSGQQLNTAVPSLSLTPVSPTDSEPPSLFSPTDSDGSLNTTIGTTPSETSKSNQETYPQSNHGLERAKSSADSARVSYKRLTSPDRFLPTRDLRSSVTVPFRLGKNPYLLSPIEKLHRRRDPDFDPFESSSSGRFVGGPRRRGSVDNRISPHHLPRHVDSELSNEPVFGLSGLGSSRRTSPSTVWNIGGGPTTPGGPQLAVSDGSGGLLGSGTVAPLYLAKFVAEKSRTKDLQAHESRLALALDIDQASRVFNLNSPQSHPTASSTDNRTGSPVTWKDGSWGAGRPAFPARRDSKGSAKSPSRSVPSTPFRVLDAPLLRDDFYCSTLAYCYTARVLAVGLGHRVYLWSERSSVQYPPFKDYSHSNYAMSLCFSSHQGGRSILAVGRHDGHVTLWSTFDPDPRFEIKLPNPVSCVSFKGVTTRRVSEHFGPALVDTEDLAVGDDLGYVWYYSVEWTDPKFRRHHRWGGAMILLAKIAAHSQQICGMAWSPDGKYLATGGNDNACLLFDIEDLVQMGDSPIPKTTSSRPSMRHSNPNGEPRVPHYPHVNTIQGWYNRTVPRQVQQRNLKDNGLPRAFPSCPSAHQKSPSTTRTLVVPPDCQKHKFVHAAAVKAIAFAPWQSSLLATGGGTNDRCIRFYHTTSGACLATINVHAQITSLIWSKTRREIAATFGYAQPEHPFRIAVFSWPSCEQVVAISWSSTNGRVRNGSDPTSDCGRALWAISYPGGPNEASYESLGSSRTSLVTGWRNESRPRRNSSDRGPQMSYKEGDTWWSRTAEEGCIIVASSDECVKFHEVWSGTPKNVTGTSGQLGGSDILESLEGIEKEGKEAIR